MPRKGVMRVDIQKVRGFWDCLRLKPGIYLGSLNYLKRCCKASVLNGK